MAETEQKPGLQKALSKKQAKKEILEKISGALAGYKSQFKKKEFETKLKKASKLFAVDIAKGLKKEKIKAVAQKTGKKK